MDRDPLRASEARAAIRKIVEQGNIIPTRHFREEAIKDGLTIVDAVNVLRGGVVEEAEWENGSWRYPVRTQLIKVIVALSSDEELVLVTIMRLAR